MPHEWLPGRIIACFILIVASAAWCGAQHSDEARAQARLAWMRAHQTGMWNVAPSEGAFLRGEVLKVKAKRRTRHAPDPLAGHRHESPPRRSKPKGRRRSQLFFFQPCSGIR